MCQLGKSWSRCWSTYWWYPAIILANVEELGAMPSFPETIEWNNVQSTLR